MADLKKNTTTMQSILEVINTLDSKKTLQFGEAVEANSISASQVIFNLDTTNLIGFCIGGSLQQSDDYYYDAEFFTSYSIGGFYLNGIFFSVETAVADESWSSNSGPSIHSHILNASDPSKWITINDDNIQFHPSYDQVFANLNYKLYPIYLT